MDRPLTNDGPQEKTAHGGALPLTASATVGAAQSAWVLGGLYFIPHATSGTLMLGSTLAGTSAAGTMGIIGGSGFAASVLAIVTAPLTLIAAAGTTVAVGGLEVGCYFVDERINDYDQVLKVLVVVSQTADEKLFKLFNVSEQEAAETGTESRVRIPEADGTFGFYYVRNLYIVNGVLMHRDWGPNTNLGYIGAAVAKE